MPLLAAVMAVGSVGSMVMLQISRSSRKINVDTGRGYRSQVDQYDSEYPYNCIAKIRAYWDDGSTYIGTGFLTRGYMFLTAGHNIYNRRTGKYAIQAECEFPNGRTLRINNPQSLFKFGDGYESDRNSTNDICWIDLEDYAEIDLDVLPKQMFSINRNIANINHATITGYRGDESGQWQTSSEVEKLDWNRIKYYGVTSNGISGAPVYEMKNGLANVYAVHAGGNDNDPFNKYNYGVLIPNAVPNP